jgi:hypothetical protein
VTKLYNTARQVTLLAFPLNISLAAKYCGHCRSIFHVGYTDTLKVVYFAHLNSVMKHGIILGGNSSNSQKIFTLQWKIVRLLAGVKPKNSCRTLCKILEILTFPCEYILSLMNFIVNNQEHFPNNSALHIVNMKNKNQLCRPTANL